MRDPRFILRKVSTVIPLSIIDVVCTEINALKSNSSEIRILDVGAGSAWYWEKILDRFPDIKISLSLMDAIEIDGNLLTDPKHQINRIVGQVPESLTIIPDDHYDIVLAFDLIEHLTKESGYLLLYEIDRISTHTNIIFTCNGFVWQPPSVNNPFNAHISGWRPGEFRKLGFNKIQGHTGLKILRGAYAQPKIWIKSWFLSEIDALATIMVWKIPRFAFSFTAVKRKKNSRIREQNL